MNQTITVYQGKRPGGTPPSFLGEDAAKKVRAFHRSLEEYCETPLVSLDSMAKRLGVGGIYVKDESKRFGLNAFKALGASYAVHELLSAQYGQNADTVHPAFPGGKGKVFVTATDGNHGRGVAWTAQKLGCKSVVYMPKGSSPERLEHIRKAGATASITDMNYDDAVRFANRQAREHGWIMLQDTAWEGYEDVPGWIMEGYLTLALEAYEQLQGEEPTHIFLQAGVGAFAGSAAGFFTSVLSRRPVITIVEPDKADCLYRTARANDGQIHFVTGDMDSMMAGLCCGEPCTIGWDVLSRCAEHYISMPDEIAASGMRLLADPDGSDPRIISGESGAASFGLAMALLLDESLAPLKEKIGLRADSRILCVSTEGATDLENYRKIIASRGKA